MVWNVKVSGSNSPRGRKDDGRQVWHNSRAKLIQPCAEWFTESRILILQAKLDRVVSSTDIEAPDASILGKIQAGGVSQVFLRVESLPKISMTSKVPVCFSIF